MATAESMLVLSADVEYMVRRGMTKGYQLTSLLTPPIYTALVLTRRGRAHFSVNKLLRATWLGGAAGELSDMERFERLLTLTFCRVCGRRRIRVCAIVDVKRDDRSRETDERGVQRVSHTSI